MNYLQHFEDGWNFQLIAIIALFWFGLVPILTCIIAARVFEERERGDVTGKSVFWGLITGICLSVLSVVVTLALGGLWVAVAAPPVAALVGVLAIRYYYKTR